VPEASGLSVSVVNLRPDVLIIPRRPLDFESTLAGCGGISLLAGDRAQRYTGDLNDESVDNMQINSSPPHAPSDEVAAAELALAELIIDAMDTCVKDGTWDPRTGVEGLERLLSEDANYDTKGV
jgi:hypothetical protein